MNSYQIAVMEGDGIGPEIVNVTFNVLRAAQERCGNFRLNFRHLPAGLSAYKKYGTTLPEETIAGLTHSDAAILGPLTTHIYDTADPAMVNPSGRLRKHFDLYANFRPARNYDGVRTRYQNVDLVVVRENTEGMYADRNLYSNSGEFMTDPDTALSIRLVTRKASERIAEMAFASAASRKKHVTIVHKKNVLRQGCGLFHESCLRVAERFPDIVVDDFHVDAFALHLTQKPEAFDVIVTTNMFGDILSDQAAGLIGGLGLAPGLNLGETLMIAQATHGSAPDIAGKGAANPVSEIMSAQMMLDWLGRRRKDDTLLEAASSINRAVEKILAQGRKTADLGGSLTTEEFGTQIINMLNDGQCK
ncbi:isocitrate/isopropylmalate dehydrogenase family protein [Alteribacillus sp. HJP-4]|uniref:isocitrate/isopropylmalate dehydrogenase family protein n=1 Tax=Alteribacillus sp. HJP-4 TaxID=2775394 RepID=UPI0035CD0E7E